MRVATKEDIPYICKLWKESMETKKFTLYQDNLDEEACMHWFLPREEVLYVYVLVDDQDRPTDFMSFYSIPSSVLNDKVNPIINVAYLFYYAVKDDTKLSLFMKSILIEAKSLNFDVFNCLDVADNGTFLKDLKFGSGDGRLRFYLYNWRTKPIPPNQVSFVML